MGACASEEDLSAQAALELEAERTKARKMDKVIAAEKTADQLVNKLLLLGAGGSGKSTLFKQMTAIYGKGFPTSERKKHKPIIHNNVIMAMQTLCQRCTDLGLEVAPNLLADKRFFEEIKDCEEITEHMGAAIKELWHDPAIQQTYEKRALFQLTDSSKYFFEQIETVAAEGFIPSEQDVFRSRVPTTGIVENEFVIEGSTFRILDVGGQRSERKKWIHCFENVTAVLFVCAISEYDEVLYEDDTQNRIVESLTLFEQTCNSVWFQNTSLILFLNKRDLFQEKIAKVPLKTLFVDYTGPDEYEHAVDYIQQQFESKNRAEHKIYTHATCACDTSNVSAVFNAVKDIVIKKGLARAGLM
jgi:GTPase SAR1 family protein